MHVAVSESYVLNGIVANGPYCQPDSTGIDSLKKHVCSFLNCDSIVLSPDINIMNPNVVTLHIDTISVKSRKFNETMTICIRVASVVDLYVSNL